ncbi:MAG: 50S ribosomal protein L6 [Fimbriimonadaceae bacterium]|jgi:large subunit ribosomal protein L6|nr:50S ribosomal protein L6 [Chthonomonadaceae bacterium]MCO5295711.1 50S ribosomal protein L6 [Fimbriimonadaceae bacterium]
MSRIGMQPITVPSGVTVDVAEGNHVTVRGPKGELKVKVGSELQIVQEGDQLKVERTSADRHARSQHGLARTLINNCIVGVTTGHTKVLEVVGVGYRIAQAGGGLTLNMGFSHPVNVDAVPGITFEVAAEEKSRVQQLRVSGIDKALVGQVAADIRKVRKPDPYKGKGIRYKGELVRLKPGKRAAAKK